MDRFEYWYSSDEGVTYKILGSRANSNGAPYTQSTSLTFRAASLAAGSYLFKVRGGNEKAFGDFSATAAKVWAPVQVTDQVTAATAVGGSLSDLIGPLAMGAIAYFAYKALYPEIMAALGDSALGDLFGIPSSAVQNMKNAAGNFKLIQVGDSIQTPYNNDTITFVAGAGIEITAEADAGIITIAATGGGTGGAITKIVAGDGITVTPSEGVGEVTISISGVGGGTGTGPVDSGGATSGSSHVLNGSVFPCTYDVGGQDKPAIFAHSNLIFANSVYDDKIKRENVITPDTILTPVLTAPTADAVPVEPPSEIAYDTDQFTGGPKTASTAESAEAQARAEATAKATALYGNTWTETSFSELKVKLNDGGTYTATFILRVQYPRPSTLAVAVAAADTRTDNYCYYSKCTYNSAVAMPDQSWSEWKKWKASVTETQQVLRGYTNPPISSSVGYIVDGEYTSGGVGLKSPDAYGRNRDAFRPNLPDYTTTSVVVDYQTVKCAPGEMVVFGACNRDLGDTVAFSTNTIFGIEKQDTVNRNADLATFAGTKAVTNGSIYISPDPTVTDMMYWSTDTITWNKVVDVTFTGVATTNQDSGHFSLMPYNNVIGKFIAYRNFNSSTIEDSIAYSSDGKAWTEAGNTLPITSLGVIGGFKSNNTSGEYIGYTGGGAYQFDSIYAHYSNNGLTWTPLPDAIKALGNASSMYPIPGSTKWIVGTKYFTLSSGVVGNFTFNSGVQTIEQYVTTLLAARVKPSGFSSTNTVRTNLPGTVNIIPRSATSFYVVIYGSGVRWANPAGTSQEFDSLGTIYSTYTVSGTAITASSFTTTNPGAPAAVGDIITLTPGVTRYTKYPETPVAYATEYHYPGVAGEPVIYRAGDYGVGAYSNSVSLNATYST